MKDFISIADFTPDQIRHFLDVAKRLKQQYKSTGKNDALLAGKTLAMVFEKPSLRTRVSFAVAMTHLGGNGLLLRDEEVGLGKREPVQDVARVLSGMCDGIMARTFEHAKITDLAKYATVPVINGLTDYNHPCQAMADMLTLEEHFGDLKGRTLAYVGDGNNVTRSLAIACGKLGMRFVCATPAGYMLPNEDVDRVMSLVPDMEYIVTNDPAEAVQEADAVYTDTWVSMGQEAEKARRIKDFAGFCIDEQLLSNAPKQAVVLHCLPAYRGLEISDAVMEGPQSLIFPQAENRLHAQKGIIAVLMAGQ
ncbi:MAG TPA: ornithine carbamoyltransferase [Tepidisphaeraceae bacterium]|jgi:ornithine carbamoyltransferase|nr:ornithine carbamoyltransferase [Tepidisphaeraceae bacterium]